MTKKLPLPPLNEGEQGGGQAPAESNAGGDNNGGPTFTFQDAANAVSRGDFDAATDIAGHLSQGERQQIETAIENKKNGGQQSRQSRQRGTTSME